MMAKYRFLLSITFLNIISVGILKSNVENSSQRAKSNIKVLFTAALLAEDYEDRKRRYIRNLSLFKKYGVDVYIVESCSQGPTYLDSYCNNVCYTKSNDPSLTKSFNEGLSMAIGLRQFKFDPEDMVIKITGRYVLETDDFIKLILNNRDADIFLRAWNDHDAYTGLYAVRAKYFEDFLNNHYLGYIGVPEKQYYAIEHGFGDYVTMMSTKGLKIVYLPHVYDYLPACIPTGYFR